MISRFGWITLALVAVTCNGCMATTKGREHQREPKELRAYDKVWKLVHTTRFDSRYYFLGITAGGDSRPVDLIDLYKEDGSKISLHERIYALQRDGSYKRIDCCTGYGGLSEPVFSTDNKLIFHLQAAREKVTDCRAHPPNAPDNDQRPPAERITVVDFLGEFDPASERVLLNSFFPGIKPGTKPQPSGTMQQYYELLYRNRAPFACG